MKNNAVTVTIQVTKEALFWCLSFFSLLFRLKDINLIPSAVQTHRRVPKIQKLRLSIETAGVISGLNGWSWVFIVSSHRSWDSLLVWAPDLWSKGCEFESRQGRWENFLLRSQLCVLTLIQCWLLFSVHSTPVLLQWYAKDPSLSAKRTGVRLHLIMHTPLTQQSQSGLIMPLCRHSVVTYQETSSHATCQGTLGHSHLSSLSQCGLILA